MLIRTSKAVLFLLIAFGSLLTAYAQAVDYTKWVNPFIGTGGHGHTFPGATMPFGMVQLSPDTRKPDWDGSSGYHYSDDTIYGFSHTHLSGTGIPDYCDILFMPTVGEPQFFAKAADKSVNGYASKFSHSNEKAEPGYYSVKLDDDRILAEMTATQRVGMHRYTFPKTSNANIVIDLKWRDKLLDFGMRQVGNNRIEGYRRSSSWATNQIVYFVAEFSKSITDLYLSKPVPFYVSPGQEYDSRHTRLALQFGESEGEQIVVKVALSPVSVEGARKNLAAELPGWDFDKVRADAKAAWNKELSKIEVSGGTDAQTTTFYTALYHTMIQPNIFNDVDGSYLGHDKKIHNISDDAYRGHAETPRIGEPLQKPARSKGTRENPRTYRQPPASRSSDEYTVFSLWDTFRAAHPLYTIIEQKRTVDFINTFIRQYEQGGRLPVWELAGNETDCMVGYHAVSVIADAMAKGIKGFDYEKAYEAAKHSAELDQFGLAAYKKRGYISMEDENESVSKTLEYAYDDWCIAQMAEIIGDARARSLNKQLSFWTVADDEVVGSLRADYWSFSRRARSFENLFDPQTGFVRPKKNGGFVTPFAPNEVTFNYTEGNAWVYSFFVPQDISHLMELYGGKEKFAAKLDELFTTTDKLAGREQPDITGLIGQYAHGNEPSHHIAYLYNYAHQPWKTQKLVRRIMDEFYKPTSDGLIGNEDCGQMSAWYVMSSLGLYQVTPGEPAYQLGTPLFREAKIHLENGKTFSIKAPNVSEKNFYVKSRSLNGKDLIWATSIDHQELINGGTLEFEMSGEPTPFPSMGGLLSPKRSHLFSESTAVPIIGDGRRVFRNSMTVTMQTITPDSTIHYTLNGSEPIMYKGPFTISATTTIRAIAKHNSESSKAAEATFNLIPNNWTVSIASKYNRQYTGGGEEGLIDGIRGTTSFASGEWQGYQGQDFVATIDLQKATEIKKVGGGFLQNAGSWIWMPTLIEFEVSDDNVNFKKVADIKTDIVPTDMESKIRDYTQTITPVTVRFVRIHAYNLGKIPSWHPGAGDEAFIFVDEVIIE
jgi:putative alpha-1,2-mannosidase